MKGVRFVEEELDTVIELWTARFEVVVAAAAAASHAWLEADWSQTVEDRKTRLDEIPDLIFYDPSAAVLLVRASSN